MKRLISLLLMLTITAWAAVASGETMLEALSYEDMLAFSSGDEMQLFAYDDAAAAELEERLTAAWSSMSSYIPEQVTVSVKLPQGAVYIGDLKISKTDITSLYSAIFNRKDPRQFFYVQNGFSGAAVKGQEYMIYVVPMYSETDKAVIEATWEEIDKAVEEILLYVSPNMTQYEKVMAVHDYMAYNYEYDETDTEQNMLIVLDKKGVCAAYTYAFIHLMNVLEIDCGFISSADMSHAWNVVKIDGEWYHIDITWDHLANNFAYATHTYSLLSTEAVKQKGHYGFDTGDYVCDSTLYDNWDYLSVYCGGMSYFIKDNNLVDEKDNVIFEKLDGGDGKWNIGGGYYFPDAVYAALCELNGKIYFNTDRGIYCYNPKTAQTELLLEKMGICGIFADENILRYNLYNTQTGLFEEAGSIRLSPLKLSEPYYKNGEAVVEVYNDSEAPLWIVSKGDTYQIRKITKKGINKLTFDNGQEQQIFIWKDSLEPVIDSVVIQ